MKIDDILNSTDTNYTKAVKAIKLWHDLEGWCDSQTIEVQQAKEKQIVYTLSVLQTITNGISKDELKEIMGG